MDDYLFGPQKTVKRIRADPKVSLLNTSEVVEKPSIQICLFSLQFAFSVAGGRCAYLDPAFLVCCSSLLNLRIKHNSDLVMRK